MNQHPLCFEIIDQKIIEFLSNFENSSKDVHLRAISYCSMAASCDLSTLCHILEIDLSPLLCGNIELPEISKLVVILVLPSKDKDAVTLSDSGVSVSLNRESLGWLFSCTDSSPD